MLCTAVAAHDAPTPTPSERVGRHRLPLEPTPRRAVVTDVSVSGYLGRVISALAVLTLIVVVSAVSTPEVEQPVGPSTVADVEGWPAR